jgi:hypothetical protein
MVEGSIDCIRRGFQALLAVWPLLIARLVETIIIVVVIVGGIVLSLIPLGLSLGFDDVESWIDDPESVAEWLVHNAWTFFALFMVVAVLAGIAVLIHSFFEAGVTALYLDHVRSGASFDWSEGWSRFSLDAFTTAALARGWAVFLVYNIVWGVAGAVLLIPLGLMLVVLLRLRDSPVAIVVTCLGLVVVGVVAIVVSIVATIWAQIAVTLAAGERRGPVESSGRAGDLMRDRLGVTILTAIITYAVIFGLSTVTSTFNMGLGALAEVPGVAVVALALQIGMFLVNSIVSTVLGLWTAAVWAVFVASAATGPGAPQGQPRSGGDIGTGRAVVG